jgi:hypothetical protein
MMFVKFYKKSLYFGKKRVIKFTPDALKKSAFKCFWIMILMVVLITLILGGLSLLSGNQQSTQPSQQIQLTPDELQQLLKQ